MTFGIIGYGAFGQLAASILSKYTKVFVYDINSTQSDSSSAVKFVDIDQVAKCDFVLISSGIESLEQICKDIADKVSKQTIVFDVCATKVKAVEILNKNLKGKCQLMSAHPLFGPQTVDSDLSGQSIVLFPIDLQNESMIDMFFESQLGLNVIKMSPEDHDQEMAWVHGLTFFVGRGLLEISPPKSQLTTGYYQKLLDIVEMESNHSKQLFLEVEKFNPFASEIRKKFTDKLEELEKGLKND